MWTEGIKIVPVITGVQEGTRWKPSVVPRPTVSHRAAEEHTNDRCLEQSLSGALNRLDILLSSGLTGTPPPDNW